VTAETLRNTQWEISGTAKRYVEATEDYIGAIVATSGLMVFGDIESDEPCATGTIAPTMATNEVGVDVVVAGSSGVFTLGGCTLKGKKFVSTSGTVVITPPPGAPAGNIENFGGDMENKITFKKNTFTGSITYTNGDTGVATVVNITGKLLDKFPDQP
jgi:hypothetical protein